MDIQSIYQIFKQSAGVCTDSRNITPNCLFFCLKGENFNGHSFAEEALKKGANFVIIDEKEYQKLPRTILVEDALSTLQTLANFHRKELALPIIAITGSNGKTTSKELIYSILRTKFITYATQGNLNNHIGVPLTLLSLTPQTQIGVIEMGANHPKEIDFLCQIAEPDFGYITNFGRAHLEGFGSLEGVIKAKSELYEYLKAHKKTIFFNKDNPKQKELLRSYSNTYSFSLQNEKANVSLKVDSIFPVKISHKSKLFTSQLMGRHNAENVAAAICIGKYFKIPEKHIAQGIENYFPKNNRSEWIKTPAGNSILLDAYNANPDSMSLAIENFKLMQGDKKILILGDMKELGKETAKEHQLIIEKIKENVWENVLLVGENFGKTQNDFHHFNQWEDVFSFLKLQNYQNCSFLIKGSRAMRLENTAPAIP